MNIKIIDIDSWKSLCKPKSSVCIDDLAKKLNQTETSKID